MHAVAPQTYGVHGVEVTGVQPPRPLHVLAGTAAPVVHAALLHVVPEPGYAPHAVRVDPSHCALHAPVPPHAVRLPCGAPTIAEQVPGVGPSHASHSPAHAESQQTPSTHDPVAHCAAVARLHAAP